MADRIKLRRGPKSKIDLNVYELGYATDSTEKRLYFNDGSMVPIPNEKDINDIKAELTEATNVSNQNKQDVSELKESVAGIIKTGVAKLVQYSYDIELSENTQKINIPYERYSSVTDTLKVYVNGLAIQNDQYTITDPVENDGIVTNGYIVLKVERPAGTIVRLEVWKNVPSGEEGEVSGNIIAQNSLPLDRIIGIDDINSQLNTRMKDICSITRNIANKKVKLIGDSITAGVGSSDYSCTGDIIYNNNKVNIGVKCWSGKLKQYLENNFSCNVNNFGISGIKSNDIVSNISSLINSDDDIIICMIGTNNRLVNKGDTTLESDLRTIYNYVVSLNKDIIFMSPIPGTLKEETGKVGTTKYFQNYEVDNIYNKVCGELGIEYISLYKLLQSYLENTSTNLSNILDSSDQQHPNDYGYNILYNLILKSLGFSDRGNLENIYDTGWIDLTLNSGFTPNSNNEPKIRRIGKQVFLRGEFTWDAPSTSSSFAVAFSIPSGFIPSYEVDFEFTIFGCFADGFINNEFRIRNSNFTSDSPIQLSKVNPYLID